MRRRSRARPFLPDPTITTHPCQSDPLPIDLGDNADLAAEAFGTGSVWEDVPSTDAVAVPSARRLDIRRALLALRR